MFAGLDQLNKKTRTLAPPPPTACTHELHTPKHAQYTKQERNTASDKRPTHLPGEEADHAEVDGHVGDSGRVVPLLHLRHKRRCHRPRHHDARAGVQVRAREELLSPEEGVDGSLDRRERPEGEKERARVIVTVAYLHEVFFFLGGGPSETRGS